MMLRGRGEPTIDCSMIIANGQLVV